METTLDSLHAKPSRFFAGLDLGQAADYTALAVVEQHPATDGVHCYDLRLLDRWKLGTPYPVIVRDVVVKFSRHPLRGIPLCVDNTGVGRAVMDIFRQQDDLQAKLVPVTIVNAFQPNIQKGEWHVPKKDLVGVLQVLFGTKANGRKRLLISPALSQAKQLERELATFKVKVNKTTGHESFESWRAKDHDDLVLAVSLPLWYAEKGGGRHPAAGQFRVVHYGGKKKEIWLRIMTRVEYDALALEQRHLLVNLANPDQPWERPKNVSLVDSVSVEFLDVTPEEGMAGWNEVREPYGKKLCELVMEKRHAKAVWAMLMRKHDRDHEGIVVLDEGDRRGPSVAMAISDILNYPRTAISRYNSQERFGGDPPNRYVYDLTKLGRSMVYG